MGEYLQALTGLLAVVYLLVCLNMEHKRNRMKK